MTSKPRATHRNLRERGQIVVIFALGIIVFVGLAAVVVDVSWYWANTLRMQRAADAAALAGVVYLPGNPALAISTARAEAVKNGYTDGVGGVAVTPIQDPQDSRRMRVTVSGPVNTYFARVLGLTSLNARRDSKADFVLPVPMGSPQNYYGVSALKGTTVTTTTNHNYKTNQSYAGETDATDEPVSGTWTSSQGSTAANRISSVSAADTNYDYATANNAVQYFGDFGLNTGLPSGEAISGNITGLTVKLNNYRLSANCSGTNKINVALSWNNGGNWTTVTAATANMTNTTNQSVTFGTTTATTFWTGHTTWTASDISDANFRIRLTAAKTCSTGSVRLRLDQLQVRAYYTTDNPSTSTSVDPDPTTRIVADPGTGAALASQGFWGAVITKGGERGNGDRYSPAFNGNPTANAEYDQNGYDYTIEVGSSGKVSIYDPTFCATGANTSSGSYGTGDHWIGTAGRPVTTVFTLYGINSTPLDLTDDVQVATSGALFVNEVQADYSGNYGQPAGWSGINSGSYTNCGTNIYHNQWWSMATGLAAGTYRLNVKTSSANNDSTSAENMWSLWVSGGAKPRVYGGGKMAAYNNLEAGTQRFYLAQIDKVHAGKTMVIELFDPGDISGNGYLRILSPDGNAYNYATFDYLADNGRSGNGVTQIQTASGGSSYFNNSVLTIQIALPASYGSVGLKPSGETEDGWWKIEYQVGGGNDTTTWAVSIRGNPVHLVLP